MANGVNSFIDLLKNLFMANFHLTAAQIATYHKDGYW